GWNSGTLSSAMMLRDGGDQARVVRRQDLAARELAREGRQPYAADPDEDEDVGERQGEALAAERGGDEPEVVQRLRQDRPHGHDRERSPLALHPAREQHEERREEAE